MMVSQAIPSATISGTCHTMMRVPRKVGLPWQMSASATMQRPLRYLTRLARRGTSGYVRDCPSISSQSSDRSHQAQWADPDPVCRRAVMLPLVRRHCDSDEGVWAVKENAPCCDHEVEEISQRVHTLVSSRSPSQLPSISRAVFQSSASSSSTMTALLSVRFGVAASVWQRDLR